MGHDFEDVEFVRVRREFCPTQMSSLYFSSYRHAESAVSIICGILNSPAESHSFIQLRSKNLLVNLLIFPSKLNLSLIFILR